MLSKVIYGIALALPLLFLFRRHNTPPADAPATQPTIQSEKPQEKRATIMQPPRDDLQPPKDGPFTLEQLQQYDGSDPSKPIYVSIKGDVFDVTRKADVYGPGKSYNIFAGKDGSKGLGMSSLKVEDAVPDWSGLPDNEKKVLDDWHSFFSKRYNVVGRVVDLPDIVAR
ncbi:cytochrome b5 [Coniophora puteana RWD-64-598 SS2]|uniref:Cytochrome b5 n=1 Tax=Coniophora puteana (strain RWD-64-598) TaxID=741705 RepID=A0A5M3MVR1_CONPW|nr:cytochrome b5 [Coniophora puteana RWD-64-598 SS2]EIW83107.1 cytochrome b5 [Coniophora puteana RWD-64-598 SS2]